MENEDEPKTHLHVGCQGERGMTGHLRALIPGQGTPHHIWDGVGCDRSTHHTNPRSSSSTGRARIVTNRVVRSTRVAAAEVPSVPDDQVTLPVPWDPTIIHILGTVNQC